MARYFISYSRRDGSAFAKRLYEELQPASPDIQLWFDQVDEVSGYPLDKQVSDAIKECDGVLVVLTRDYGSSALHETKWGWRTIWLSGSFHSKFTKTPKC